jgi:haloalkane dehalogenase
MGGRERGMDIAAVIEAHGRAGRRFTAAGVVSFVRERGVGEPVVCMHGVPASSFLYRKLIAELASRGLRGVAFDLPGLGLADRPADFDYTWTGLGRFAVAAVDALGWSGSTWWCTISAARSGSSWPRRYPRGCGR